MTLLIVGCSLVIVGIIFLIPPRRKRLVINLAPTITFEKGRWRVRAPLDNVDESFDTREECNQFCNKKAVESLQKVTDILKDIEEDINKKNKNG